MMSSAFEDSLLDFDLSAFQPSSNNAVVCVDKACKAITKTKRKIISTDVLLNKYKHLSLSYKELEKSFVSSKEEHKQACIDTMEYREKCFALDKVIKDLQLTIKDLEVNCVTAQNKHDGMQSHAKQLEQLVKENETSIESLKVENLSQKAINAKLQKQNEQLSKNMCYMRNFVAGKKKLPKELKSFALTRVKKSADDALYSEEIRCDDVNTLDEVLLPDFEIHNDKLDLALPIEKLTDKNTCGSELRSFDINEGSTYSRIDHDQDEDDGRGSSIAFSDSDKCFNSPEYSINSPFTADFLRSKNKLTVTVSTSPLPINDAKDVATSPIIFKNLDILDGIEKNVSNEINSNGCDNKRTGDMIDRILSPIFATHYIDVSTSPLKNSTNDVATSPLQQDGMSNYNNQQEDQNTQEKYLMKINHSSCLEDENSNDCEVQMIFDSMRFSQKLITPIPTTPAKSRNLEVSTDTGAQTMQTDYASIDSVQKLEKRLTCLVTTIVELKEHVDMLLSKERTEKTPHIISGDRKVALAERDLEDRVLVHNIVPMEISKVIDNNAIHSENRVLKLKKLNSILFADSSPPSPSDAAPPLPPRPSDAALPSPPSPREAALPPPPRPSDAAVLSPPSPRDAALHSPPRPSDAALLSLSRPRHAAIPSPPRPTYAALHSLPRPSDAALFSPPSPIDAALPSTPHPTDAAMHTPPLPSDAALFSRLSLGDAVLHSPPRPSDAAVTSPPSPSDAALFSRLSLGDAALHSPPRASDAALTSPPSPSDAAPPSVPPSPLTLEQNNVDNSICVVYDEEDICPKENERLQFEALISSRGSVKDIVLSDSEMYESEIVIELPPDTLESDTNSLHEMLKKQDLKQQILHAEDQIKKLPKKKKITKLEKLRQRMLPKSKIKNVDEQVKRRKRIQPKRLNTNGDRISVSQISRIAAYEKACKVMSELRSKEKVQKKDDYVTVPKLSLSPKKGALNTFKCSERTTDLFDTNKNLQESCIQTQNQGIGQSDLSKLTSAIYPVKLNKPTKPIYEISNITQICKKSIEKNKTTPELAPTLENSKDFKKNRGLPGQISIRTRSQSQSHDVSRTQKPEICSDPILPPLSPKMYGKNRRKSKVEESLMHNDTIVDGLIKPNIVTVTEESNGNNDAKRMASRTKLKRQSVEVADYASKRMLRSSSVRNDSTEPRSKRVMEINEEIISRTTKEIVTYGDIDIFEETEKHTNEIVVPRAKKYGIFCHVLDRYCRKSKKSASKLPENAINFAYKKIEDGIAEIRKLPDKDHKVAMDKLVKNLQGLKQKQILAGIIKFLKEPTRKIELQSKKYVTMAPPLTEAEAILIYIVSQFKVIWPDIVENIMSRIEHSLFMLNRSPDCGVIETVAHFYAVLCRYDDKRPRLRMFIMDAMYCMQFKAIPLIKQCMEVDMKIFPLAHMAKAKESLVTCLVYLLHFFKCEDRKNILQDIRNLFHRKYFYDMSEWNEPRILEMFRNSIMQLSDLCAERRMLSTAFILLAKRNGALWCQNNIIQNMLLPIIEQPQVPDRVKQFCVSLLGALLKPYPMDMRVNCEIVMNQLFAMLSRNQSDKMVEAIFTSLIHMSKHNPNRVIKALVFWKPAKISPEMENLLKNFVKERPLKSWRTVISKFSVQQT